MEIVDALSKLGFSFWQVTVLIVILLFRQEIKSLFGRLSAFAFKFGSSEIKISSFDTEIVRELAELKSRIAASQSKAPEQVIEERIQHKAINALLQIKQRTHYLWDVLEKGHGQKRIARIRKSTFREIENALEILRIAGLLNYRVEEGFFDSWTGDPVLELTLTDISPELSALVDSLKGSQRLLRQ